MKSSRLISVARGALFASFLSIAQVLFLWTNGAIADETDSESLTIDSNGVAPDEMVVGGEPGNGDAEEEKLEQLDDAEATDLEIEESDRELSEETDTVEFDPQSEPAQVLPDAPGMAVSK